LLVSPYALIVYTNTCARTGLNTPTFPTSQRLSDFLTEAQFEAYRALDYQIGEEVFSNEQVLAKFK